MATPESLAIRREAANQRIDKALTTLAERFAMDAPKLDQRLSKDEAVNAAMQTEKLADVLEELAKATEPATVTTTKKSKGQD